MATLENIRRRGPLVAIIIGFAMLAFILGDFLNSGGSLFSNDQFRIAQIDDVSVDYQEYEQKVLEATELYKQRMNIQSVDERLKEEIKRQVWDDMIQSIIMGKEYEKLGVFVSPDELFDLVQGKNIDPMMRQIPIFINQQTGLFDPALVVYFLKNMDQDKSGNSKATWIALEGEIMQNQLNRKYMNLILKGLYISNKEAEKEFIDRNYIVDFDFISSKFSDVSDSSISITDADIKEYYDKHQKDFEQEASRDLAYVTFTVVPSSKDSLYTQEWINKILKEFTTTDDNKQFINFNSDISLDESHYKKSEYPNIDVDSILFNSEVNTIYGPYFEDGSYKLAKLLEVKNLPDSVKVKHILIQPNGKNIVDINQAKAIADSLKTVIKNGGNFAEIAKNYSTDKKSGEEGGEMGWYIENQAAAPFQIKPFNLLVDSSLNKIIILEYNYGIHLIAVSDKSAESKKIKVGVVERKIMASSETYQSVYSEASKFAGENRSLSKFEKSVEANKLIKKVAPGITQSETFIAGLESPREMIRWAFKAEKNDVSQVFEFANNYVIAALTEIREKGIAPIEQVNDEIKFYVSKEKKIALLKENISKLLPSDLETLANKLSQEVKEARNVSFTSFQIQGLGYEPNVIANAVSLEKDKVSAPIEGENGVYVIKVKSVTPAPAIENMNLIVEKSKLTRNLQQRTMQQIFKALKTSSEITDERSKFY